MELNSDNALCNYFDSHIYLYKYKIMQKFEG